MEVSIAISVVCPYLHITKTTYVQVDIAQYCLHDFLMTHNNRLKWLINNIMHSVLIKGAAIADYKLGVVPFSPTFQTEIPT